MTKVSLDLNLELHFEVLDVQWNLKNFDVRLRGATKIFWVILKVRGIITEILLKVSG